MSFNSEQLAHLKHVNSLTPEDRCGCGWFSSYECQMVCLNKASRKPEDKAVRDRIDSYIEQCAKICDDWVIENYKLKDTEEYKSSNQYRQNQRFAGEQLAKRIRKLKRG